MAPRRKADEDDNDPEWAWHLGHFATGHISQLREKETRGAPFETNPQAMKTIGFDITPGQTRRRRRKKK